MLAAVDGLVVGAEHLGRGVRDGDAARRRHGAHARRLYAWGCHGGVGFTRAILHLVGYTLHLPRLPYLTAARRVDGVAAEVILEALVADDPRDGGTRVDTDLQLERRICVDAVLL